MGLISQTADAANAKQITIVGWFQRVVDAPNTTLMEFGDRFVDIDQAFARNHISLRTDLDVGNTVIEAYISGVRGSQTRTANLTGDSDNINYIAEVDKAGTFGDAVTPYTSIRSGHTELTAPGDLTITKSLNEKTALGNWFLLFLCFDMSATELMIENDQSTGTWNTGWCFVNGENHGNGGQSQPNGPFGGSELEDGRQPGKLYTNVFDVTGHQSFADYFAELEPDYGAAGISIPGWNVGIDGFEFGIPVTSAGIADNPGVRLSDVQVWLGQCIDPNVHMDKFVTIADGFGTPVNPTVAATEFGAPTYRIRGPASAVATNAGTAGDLVQTGTVTDVVGSPVRFAV